MNRKDAHHEDACFDVWRVSSRDICRGPIHFTYCNFEGIGLILATPTAPMKTPTAPMKTDLPLIQVETAMVSKPTDTAFCVRDPSDFGC